MDKISQALGIIEPEVIEAQIEEVKESREQMAASKDLESAKQNMRELIEDSMGLMPSLVSLIAQAESPRMYESGAAFIKMIAELNKDLVGMAAPKAAEKKAAQPATDPGNTAIFIGTGGDVFSKLSRRHVPNEVIEHGPATTK